jgi:hypothetical protein
MPNIAQMPFKLRILTTGNRFLSDAGAAPPQFIQFWPPAALCPFFAAAPMDFSVGRLP